MTDPVLRCSLCGHEETRPWTQVVLGERCPRCATGRLLQVDVRLVDEGVRPRNTRP